MSTPLLKINQLNVQLTHEGRVVPIVKDLSFTLKKGKTLVIVGESGSGKSVACMSLLRLNSTPPFLPASGEVLYHGTNLLTLPQRKLAKIRGKKISMIFQNPRSSLNPVYSIGFQLKEVVEDEELIIRTLQEVQLNGREILDRYPHELSGGMLQRVMIALALLSNPEILIADEPTTALDVTIQKEILKLLQDIQQKRSLAILLVTHDFGVVREMADEILVMYAGEKVEEGPQSQLFQAPLHPYTKALLELHEMRKNQGRFSQLEGDLPSFYHPTSGCKFHPRCPKKMEICTAQTPSLLSIKERCVRCLLYENTPS